MIFRSIQLLLKLRFFHQSSLQLHHDFFINPAFTYAMTFSSIQHPRIRVDFGQRTSACTAGAIFLWYQYYASVSTYTWPSELLVNRPILYSNNGTDNKFCNTWPLFQVAL